MSSAPTNTQGTKAAHRSGFVTLIGPANAGKSTLLNAFVGSKVSIVSPKEQTTRTRILGIKSTPEGQILFLDTPGFLSSKYKGELSRSLSSTLSDTAKEGDITVLLLDATTVRNNDDFCGRLLASVRQRGVSAPAVIVLNKVDRLEKPSLLPLLQRVEKELVAPLAESGTRAEIVPISALKGDGVQHLYELLLSYLPEGPAYFPADAVSDQPERFLAAEIVREKLFLQMHQEIPYSAAVQIEQWHEGEELLHIGAVIFVERVSQRKMVIGEGAKRIKAIGQAARLELERIFTIPIFLELFVKVEPDWTKTSKGLQKVGFYERSDG